MINSKMLNTLWCEWLQPVALIAAVMLPFRSAIADWNVVPTGSMNSTIVEGDRIFINKQAPFLVSAKPLSVLRRGRDLVNSTRNFSSRSATV